VKALPTSPDENERTPQQAEMCAAGDKALAARITELSRAAFQRPQMEYHGWTRLRDIPGYDAVRFVQLLLALEAEFAITLHEDEVDSIATMGDILALLRARLLPGD